MTQMTGSSGGASTVTIILTVTGAAVLLGGVRLLFHGWATERWPTTEGRILESKVASATDAEGDKMFRARVRYEYQVAGTTHVGQDIRVVSEVATSWKGPARRAVERYARGSRCRVYYDPRDPARALLEPGAPWYLYLLPAVGAVLLAIGVAGLMGRVVFGGD